jgi:hypothetical protein
MRCAAITSAGERCKLDATSGSYCWSHAPENAEERRRRARRGGKAKGAGELDQIKRELRIVIADVLEGRVDKGRAAVALQGYNALIRVVEVARRDDLEDLAREVEELKRGYGGAA